MPLYTAVPQDGIVLAETKARIADEITRIHTTAMKNFVRVVFLSYPKGAGFTDGGQASEPVIQVAVKPAIRTLPEGA